MFLFYIHLFFTNLILVNSLINTPEESSLHSCFASIANKYLDHLTNVLIGPRFGDVSFLRSKLIQTGNSTEFLVKSLPMAVGSYIISYRYIEELNETLIEIGASNLIHYVIIANIKSDVLKISEIMWQFHLYKSVILLSNNKFNKVELYAIDLKHSKCGTIIKPIKINECIDGNFKKKLSIFSPDIKKCFRMCSLRIIWSKYPPWIYDSNDTEPGIYRDILSLFEERSQFKMNYMPKSDVYFEELSYYNFGSVIADFDRDYADIFIGLVDFSVPSSYVSTIGVIYDDNMYFVVPNPKMIPYWKLIGKLFLPSMWICSFIFVIFLCGIFTLLAFIIPVDRRKFSNMLNNIFYLYSLSVNVGFYKVPKSFILRLLLGCYLLTAMILISIMQGKYYSFLNSPLYEKRITNVEQLINSEVPIKCAEGLRLLFMFPIGDEKNKRLLEKMEVLPSQDMAMNLKEAYEENFATITDRGLLIMNPHLKDNMQIFKIYSFVTCFLMQKNHVLYEYVSKNLTTIVESGFVNRFVSKMIFKYSGKQQVKEEHRLFQLKLTHVQGPFIILIAGYIAAIFGFVLEHIFFCCKKYKNRN